MSVLYVDFIVASIFYTWGKGWDWMGLHFQNGTSRNGSFGKVLTLNTQVIEFWPQRVQFLKSWA